MNIGPSRSPGSWLARPGLGAAVLGTVVLALAPAASAQEEQDPREATVQSLENGQRIKVTAPGIWVEDGHFLGLEARSVVLEEDQERMSIPIDEIESLHVMGRATKPGIVKGGIIGFALGAGISFFFNAAECRRPPCGNEFSHAAGTGLVTGAVGAVAGGFIGYMVERWDLRFP